MSGTLFAQLLIILVVAGLFFAVAARELGAEREKEIWKGRLKLEQYEHWHWLVREKIERDGFPIEESPQPRFRWEGDEP